MSNSIKIAFGLFLIVIMLLTYLEASEPEPVNWNQSYLESDKIALGSYVFFESWKDNSAGKIIKVAVPPYEFLQTDPSGIYFFLNDYIVFDDNELKKLLSWVQEGNSLFVSASYISKNLLDTLQIDAVTYSDLNQFYFRPRFEFVNPQLKTNDRYEVDFDIESLYFSKIDTLNNSVLGISEFSADTSDKKINFLKTGYGEGEIFLHSNPEALSNYFLLSDDNYKYAEGVLAYADRPGNIYWDSYYKSGKSFQTSPLYILLSSKPLKWAYYFILIGSLLFILFEGKRKQRAIAVVKPLRNQTFEYAMTIGDLYIEQKNFKELAIKKIDHFNDYLRNRHRITTTAIDNKFISDVAAKTKNTEDDTRDLFRFFDEISKRSEISKEELQELSNRLKNLKIIK